MFALRQRKLGDRLGELLFQAGIITKSALRAAVALHQKEGKERRLGDILVDMGVCSEKDVGHILAVQTNMRNGGLSCLTEETHAQAERVDNITTMANTLADKISGR